jgi:general secretion pathway protein M
MSAVTAVRQLRDQLSLYWLARTEQERKYLTVGGATVLGALIYSLFIAPALNGRDQLEKQLPELRVRAAKMQALALEAGELARVAPVQAAPMSKESLSASLVARSLTAESVTVSGETARVQLNGVSFAGMFSWLDAQRRESRIEAVDVAITAGTPAGQVDAVLTLRQNTEASR